MSIITALAA